MNMMTDNMANERLYEVDAVYMIFEGLGRLDCDCCAMCRIIRININ